MESVSCRKYLAEVDERELRQIITQAGDQRIMRKYAFIMEVYESVWQNWYQTFYMMLFRTMDASINKESYFRLAERIPYKYLMREICSLTSVEAMLIGGSGLLNLYPEDEYITTLKEEWNHLAAKYNFTPMRFTDWNLSKVRPYNHPVLRLAQLAMLLHKKDFFVNSILQCKTPNDIVELFSIEASEYWKSHFIPAHESKMIPKRLGKEKCYLLGINLVAPIQYAYYFNVGRDDLQKQAMDLLEEIPAENNKYIRNWQTMGIYPENAFESQGLLQISTEYCNKNRCDECPVMTFARRKYNEESTKKGE